MPLELIVGPPNSGRAGEIRRRLAASLDQEPILVVPTVDDVARFEAELCAGGETVIGASVLTFAGLFDEVARSYGISAGRSCTAVQRRRLTEIALQRAKLRRLRPQTGGARFVAAIESSLEDVFAAGLDEATLRQAAAELDEGDLLIDLATCVASYRRALAEAGLSDAHDLAAATIAAARTRPEAWRRPLLVYGFDDLTTEQFTLVGALRESTRITVAVSFEDRTALAARAGLLERLREIGVDDQRQLEPNRKHTTSATLFAIERGLFELGTPPTRPDGGVRFLRAAGERAEAELIATEVAALIADGVEPGTIAVALRAPDRYGGLYQQVFTRFGIPAAIHASIPIRSTAAGAALLGLISAVLGEGEVDGLLRYLRGPGRRSSDADWLERAVKTHRIRDLDGALEHWSGRELWEIEALREAEGPPALAAAVGRIAATLLAGGSYRSGAILEPGERTEARAAAILAGAAIELAALGPLAPAFEQLKGALEALEVPLWSGPAAERVLVGSPYRLRAGRFTHVFCAALQESEFPATDGEGGLLPDELRAAAGLAARADPLAEERYLFYVVASRPTDRLYLCSREAGEDGRSQAHSPFIEEVRELLEVPSSELFAEAITIVAEQARPAPPPELAPSADILARSLAARGDRTAKATLEGLEIAPGLAAEVQARIEAATAVRAGPGGDEWVREQWALDALSSVELYGASTLEAYAECPYRWFISKRLEPRPLEPKPEPMTQGSIIHEVLERLYGERPGDEPRPSLERLEDWRRRAGELLGEAIERHDARPGDAGARAGLEKMRVLIESYLGRDARGGGSMEPIADLLEAGFGPETEVGALELPGGFSMHGWIDRVDAVPGSGRRQALIRDYKLGKNVSAGAKLAAEGKLQLQLYMHALDRLFDLEPVGGLYEPLSGDGAQRPRGVIASELADEVGRDRLVSSDLFPSTELETKIAEAIEKAGEIVAGMRAGRIPRDPIGGTCPRYCNFQPICRREHASEDPEEAAEARR